MKSYSWLACFFVVLWCCSQPLYGARQYEKLLEKIHKEYPQLRSTSPLCIVLTSVQRCVGCGVLAVNGTMELLQQTHTTATCVVVLFVEREQEADVVRDKFLTPFMITDTAQIFLQPRFVQHYPMVLIVDGKGELLFHQADLQHTALHYTDVQKVFAAAPSTRETIGDADVQWKEHGIPANKPPVPQKIVTNAQRQATFLDEPKGYVAGNLMSPIVHSAAHTIVAINSLTNTIDAWDATTGNLRFSRALPDTVVYYFRTDSTDKRWRDWEQQGASIAQPRSLAMAGDTLCVLVDVLSGYTEEKKYGRTPIGTMDTVVEIAWKKHQLIARFYNQVFLDIIEVPEVYSLIDLHIVPNGGFGGTCLWYKFQQNQPMEVQKDSCTLLCLYGSHTALRMYQPAIQELQNLLLPKRNTAYTIGLVATASNGDIWYCDPNKNALFLLSNTGILRQIPVRGALRSCTGGIVLSDGESAQKLVQKTPYVLRGMAAIQHRVCVLLSPTDVSSKLPHILQVYEATGEFIGEYPLDTAAINAVPTLQLIAYKNGEAMLLQRTPDKRWSVVNVTLQLSSVSLPVPVPKRVVKP